jgi:hypothetical protein
MSVLTPLNGEGYPIEVPRDIYMIVFVDISVLVEAGEVDDDFDDYGNAKI